MPRSSTIYRNRAQHAAVRPAMPLHSAVAATAELCGVALSDAAAQLLADDLSEFHEPAVLAALAQCRSDLRGTLTIGEVLARLNDGRPGADEAWESIPKSEAESSVWTREMAKAWSDAVGLLDKGDMEMARRVFQDSYTHEVLMARCKRESVAWSVSLGTDPVHREKVLRAAVEKERLPVSYVEELLPYRSLSPQARHLLTQVRIKKIT